MTDLCQQPRDGAAPPAGGTGWTATGILARLAALVAERDVGDEWARAGAVLAAVARGYAVDATWLVTGAQDFRGERLPPTSRLRVADLLLRAGERLLTARRGIHAPRHRL